MAVERETELYPPVKAFFAKRGYEVKAEVRGCDLVAVRADEPTPTIVEMKKTFTLPLLLQGADRQRTGAFVWLAVERNRSKRGAHNQRFQELSAICRRLGLGFLTITFYKTKEPVAEVWCEPAGSGSVNAATRIRNGSSLATAETSAAYSSAAAAGGGRRRKGTAKLLQEFESRSGDYNVGGSNRSKLVTAYREKALQCMLAIRCHGPSAPRHVRSWTGCPNAALILRDNYYGWFQRVKKGVYGLSESGHAALAEYADIASVWAARFAWASEWKSAASDTTAADSASAVSGGESLT
ncbi:DUF2161 domain-containing phosphodiesterase [Cohnella faecalis]|uniref:Uncharacterized protein n=1 Tax=Cohnella faecalis TaxID=2315694 RepID=A0A398CTU8_9BACL|nr:DUF2161 family putative PD-(D/E)XK-type phosphodiesterase [Cohnella faecalis]RIE04138.1 hypothetical protein D3H35_08870 [Cohnella faecalis]